MAWGLLEAENIAPGEGYADAAIRNIRWALGKQQSNGWFADCCLSDASQPLTHTIGYVLRGILEGWRATGDTNLLEAVRRSADALLGAISLDGKLLGCLNARWEPTVSWVCLTGSSQIAQCFLILYQDTKDPKYLKAGKLLNSFVRRTVRVDGDPDVRGAIKGSFPVSGDYGRFEFLNWAAKFTIDANLLEKCVTAGD